MRPDHVNYAKEFTLYLEVTGLFFMRNTIQFTLVVPVNKNGVQKDWPQ